MFWLLVAALLLLTRVPAAAQYLSIDNVNLALALEHFDPRIHQPQPPGYPFFVLFARAVNFLFRDAAQTFLVISVLVSGLCLPVIHALGKRMFDAWVGKAAVLLLLVNPVFWHSGLDGPLRPNLALFSLMTAYCAWRAWTGERRFVTAGALILGVGSGFRPDLLAYLAPLWLVSSWVGTRSMKSVLQGGAVLAIVVLIWVAGLAYAVGGAGAFVDLFERYTVEQSQAESVVLGATSTGWLRQINRLVIWNGLAVIGWIWAAPLFLFAKKRPRLFGREMMFMAVWLVPGLIVQALIHVAAPGHTLFSIPPLCLLGACVLGASLQRWEGSEWALAGAVVVNVMLFMNFVPLPPPGSPGGVLDAMSVGTFESSLENIRWLDDIHGSSLREIRDFSKPDGPEVVIAQDVQQKEWFLNWRIARFYYPEYDIRVIADQKEPIEVFQVKGSAVSAAGSGSAVKIHVPPRSRILWLVGPDTALRKALDAAGAQGGARIRYTDIAEGAEPLPVMDFLVVADHGIQ